MLAWVAPSLALWVAGGGQRPFLHGWLFGLGFNLTSIYWLWFIPVTFFPILGWLALSAWQALYCGAWVWLSLRLAPKDMFSTGTIESRDRSGWTRRMVWPLACAVVWVGLEMISARLLTGFPWLTLGVSQYRITSIIQIAAWTGVYGVSFLIIWFAVSLLNAVHIIRQKQIALWAWLAEIILPLTTVMVLSALGLATMVREHTPSRTVKFALIQPSIPQTVKWDPEANKQAFAKVLRLSELAAEAKPDVILWPEAATPGLLRYDEELQKTVTTLVRKHKVWLILGADDAEPNTATPDPNDALYYNSSFLVSPKGELVAKHDKQKLVVFGEYVPFAEQLPFLKWFTPIDGGFAAGKDQTPFSLPGLDVKASILICFEDIFPHFVRQGVGEDVNLLINLTNNGWFGESAAQWQHAANATFRAVENRRSLVRCSNNGLTCWVDPWGRQTVSAFGEGDVYREGFDLATVPIHNLPKTFYTEHGDVFGWGCVLLATTLFLFIWRHRKALAGR